MRRTRYTPGAILAIAILALMTIGFRTSGSFLVVDSPEKSDAILITQRDSMDASYWMGLHLLAEGYGRVLFLDAHTDHTFFGRTQAEWAADFIHKTAAHAAGNVEVCPINVDTTAEEAYQADRCLKQRSIRSVLIVVDDFHTRRSLAMFSRLLPRYRWSTAPVRDGETFGVKWWRKRTWIRTAVVEWQHLLWWELVDRWRFAPVS